MPAEADTFDLDRILTTLEHHRVEHVMVGGLGARAHGATRPTLDVDFVPRSTGDNLDRPAAALRQLGARLRVVGLSDEESRELPVVIGADPARSAPPPVAMSAAFHSGRDAHLTFGHHPSQGGSR
jgi:hypothetical protein